MLQREHNPERLCYKDTQPGKIMLQRDTTYKGYATKRTQPRKVMLQFKYAELKR